MHPFVRLAQETRIKRGLTRDKVSIKSGVSTRTIIDWEKHNRMPSLQNIEAVLGALGYDLVVQPKPKE